jgi:hypothetical protein
MRFHNLGKLRLPSKAEMWGKALKIKVEYPDLGVKNLKLSVLALTACHVVKLTPRLIE